MTDPLPSTVSTCSLPGAHAGLSAVLAAALGTDTPDPANLVGGLLAARVVEIPGARWASITQHGTKQGFVTVAASDDVARRVDDAQYELGGGPCLTAVDGTVVSVDESAMRARWPECAGRMVAETPVRSVLSQPLCPDTALGSLNVYSDRVEGFARDALPAAAALAAACGLALVTVQQRLRADNLAMALESNRRVGAAIGIVMALSRCTYEQALDTIRNASQRTHRKMRAVADDIIFTGIIPEH